MSGINEHRLAGKAKAIKVNGWLSDRKIKELKRAVDSQVEDCQEGSG